MGPHFQPMKIYLHFVLIGFIVFGALKTSAYKIINGNVKDHGWDGPLRIDPKTGLLHPPPNKFLYETEKLAVWGTHADLYCKIFDSGSIFHKRYYKNMCSKEESGRKIDLCCTGYQCTKYGIGGGSYCDRLNNHVHACGNCKIAHKLNLTVTPDSTLRSVVKESQRNQTVLTS